MDLSPLDYTKLLLEDEIEKVQIGIGVIRRQQQEIVKYKIKEAQLEASEIQVRQLESDLSNLQTQFDELRKQHSSFVQTSEKNELGNRLEVETSLATIIVLKAQIEEKENESNKFQEMIKELVAAQKPYEDKQSTSESIQVDVTKVKDFEYIQKKIDAVREKIDSTIKRNNTKNNNTDLAILFTELNSLTTQLSDIMVRQIAEERQYSNDILLKFNEDLANQDTLLETMNDLSQQHTLVNPDRRFSFLAPENNSHLFSKLGQSK